MARSTADATRFTATGPYADGMGTSKSAALDFAEPAPPNETPQQKVARLRKAAQRAREARTTRYDRLVLKGRRWADGAHRATVYTLVAATVISGAVTIFAVADMIRYNRRKRRDWYADQETKLASALAAAQQAAAGGLATEAQTSLLEIDRESQMAAQRQETAAARPGVFQRTKDAWYSSFARTDPGQMRPSSDQSGPAQDPAENKGILAAVEKLRSGADSWPHVQSAAPVLSDSTERLSTSSKPFVDGSPPLTPGPLDRAAQNATRGWFSWLSGKK